MLLSFFIILPRGPLRPADGKSKDYFTVPGLPEDDLEDDAPAAVSSSLLRPGPDSRQPSPSRQLTLTAKLRRARLLLFPYMLPLLMVYIAEYLINQGVAPTLLFPLDRTPFNHYRSFYPFYNFIYQVGVFISRSSTPFIRIHHLYPPSLLQVANLAILISQALFNWIPSVYIVFLIIFWEGLLGGGVYVNTFAEILEHVPEEEREFSMSATSVSDSGGICIAGFVGMALEVGLCNWQVERGITWCKQL